MHYYAEKKYSFISFYVISYTTCIIKAYLFEFNKLIQQFWIQILELNVHFNFLYKIRKARQSDVKLLVFLRVCWWQVANCCHSRFCLLSEKTLMPRPRPLALIRLDGMLTKVKSKIYVLLNFNYPHLWIGEDAEKFKKEGGSMKQGQVFLKGGGWYFYLIFSRFITF